MSNWYYADAEQQRQGPLSAEEMAQRFHQGRLRLDTLVWRDGLAEWQPLRDFTQELALHQAPAEIFYTTPEPGPTDAGSAHADPFAVAPGAFNTPAPAMPDSPYAPPRATLVSANAAVHGGEVVYAGFWKRVAANVIDSLVVGIVGGIIGAIIGAVIGAVFGLNGGLGGGGFLAIQLVTNAVSIAITAVYYAWFHSSANQATLGKMAIGIKVVRSDGETISFARGIGRYFAFLLSSLILCIGLLMAAFTERKRGLHDMICDTLVVDKWAFTAHPEWQKPELGTVTIVILAIFGVLFVGAIALFAVIIGLAASSGGWH
ncbi:MAG: RDD family protein [Pseudoxanthomonas sp.]